MSCVFFTDLDGTLIFSASKRREGDVVVERRFNRDISCVSAYQAENMHRLRYTVPVTTRSIEQYLRIEFPFFPAPRFAITDNGGNLLINGVPDREWAENALRLTEKHMEELERCRAVLESDPDRCFEVRLVDGLFLFTKSDDPKRTLYRLKYECGSLMTYSTGAKVYVLPPHLDKGSAARALMERLGFEGKVIAAGDSMMDISLLNIADIAIASDNIPAEKLTAPEKLVFSRERFPEAVTRAAISIQKLYSASL